MCWRGLEELARRSLCQEDFLRGIAICNKNQKSKIKNCDRLDPWFGLGQVTFVAIVT
jgi:hypothetical protein